MKNLKLFIAAFALVFAVQVSANTEKPLKATALLQSELVQLMGSEVPFQIENGELIIVNGYTQFNWRGSGRKADYEAIREVFSKVKKEFSGLRIGYPAIGAGLARGDWKIISEIIEEELKGENHTFVEYQK